MPIFEKNPITYINMRIVEKIDIGLYFNTLHCKYNTYFV